MATSIDISNITSGVTTSEAGIVTGSGYFDDLMETISKHLVAQYDQGRLTGDTYAKAYVGLIQSTLSQSVQFALAKRNTEIKADSSAQELITKTNEATISTGTVQTKIDTATSQKNKIDAEGNYIAEQKIQLINSVIYNNKIKAIDSLSDTYGTFGAGGLTVDADMWAVYFSLIANLVDDFVTYIAPWDASTNTPDLNTVTPTKGDFYNITVDGTTNIDGISSWIAGEYILYNGTRWEKSDVALPNTSGVSTVA